MNIIKANIIFLYVLCVFNLFLTAKLDDKIEDSTYDDDNIKSDNQIYLSCAIPEYNTNKDNNIVFEEILQTVPSEKSVTTNRIKYIDYDVPDCDTNFKSYMSYRALTVKSSPQYKLQQNCWTDEDGLRRQSDDYVIAVGTYYSDTVGDRFKITLDNGFEFTAIVGDIKQDIHTNNTNQYTSVYDYDGEFKSANVIEFLVDTAYLPRKVKNLGTISGFTNFDGNIVTMQKIVEG